MPRYLNDEAGICRDGWERMNSLDPETWVRETLESILKIALPVSPESKSCCHLLRERFLSTFFQIIFRGLKMELSCIDGFRRRACCASWTSGFELLKEEYALCADSLSLHIDVDIPLELAQFIASFIAK
ncbi:hypothetical protein AVEN_52069-1 [Araneus ventricosus]|uniref:Uncharacterized protein n=1 Tax=Araneus ventricosus TaxID=182803 RepID=A0A4Y2W629_ARAVE|nr:hypothetical protein AVEN_52069-1 [Araneus ventricosus]